METNISIDISPPIPYLAKFWFLSYGPKCCQPIKLQNSLKCNISKKKWMMKCIFGMQINIEIFYKLILSFWVCATRHVQNTQNKKFGYLCNISRKACEWGGRGGGGGAKMIFCQLMKTKVLYKLIVLLWVCVDKNICNISRKTWRNELDLLSTNKRQRFLQIAIIILRMCGQECPDYPNDKFAISLQYLKKELRDEVDFLYADKHESLLQIESMILLGWSSIPEVPKIASLQCLYNISKKKLKMKLIFCMQINIKVS